MDPLDHNVSEAYAPEFACEAVDFPQGVDDPAVTESAEDALLRAAQLAAAKKAVGDHDAASRAEETV